MSSSCAARARLPRSGAWRLRSFARKSAVISEQRKRRRGATSGVQRNPEPGQHVVVPGEAQAAQGRSPSPRPSAVSSVIPNRTTAQPRPAWSPYEFGPRSPGGARDAAPSRRTAAAPLPRPAFAHPLRTRSIFLSPSASGGPSECIRGCQPSGFTRYTSPTGPLARTARADRAGRLDRLVIRDRLAFRAPCGPADVDALRRRAQPSEAAQARLPCAAVHPGAGP